MTDRLSLADLPIEDRHDRELDDWTEDAQLLDVVIVVSGVLDASRAVPFAETLVRRYDVHTSQLHKFFQHVEDNSVQGETLIARAGLRRHDGAFPVTNEERYTDGEYGPKKKGA